MADPGGMYGGYLTMSQGMGENIDRAARLNAFLQQRQAALPMEQQIAQNAPALVQSRLEGTPFENRKLQQELALQKLTADRTWMTLAEQMRANRAREKQGQDSDTRLWAVEGLKASQNAWKQRLDAYNAGLGPHPGAMPETLGMPQTGGVASGDAGGVPGQAAPNLQGIEQVPPITPISKDLMTLPPGARNKIWAQRVEERPQATNALSEAITNLSRMEDQSKAIATHPSMPWMTGISGTVARNIPSTDAKALAAQLESLRAQTAFAMLNQLRAASKTGGALGQVSNQEENMLASSIAALDPQQSSDDFRKALLQIRNYTRGAKERLIKAYKDTYGIEPDLKQYHTVVGADGNTVMPEQAGPAAATTMQYPTATGPNGQKVILKDGKWQPM